MDTMNNFENKDYEVLYVTGKNYYEEISKIKLPSNVKIEPYIDNLPGLMKNTDLIVTRSGASTLSEIIALRLPSILIPSPYVPNNHQYKNAMDLVNEEAALLIEEKNLDSKKIVEEIDNLLNDEKKLKELKNNLKKLDVGSSATIIYENIKKLISRW